MRTLILLFLILCGGAAGCRKNSPGTGANAHGGHVHGAGEDQEQEQKSAQITVWSRGFEIFAEHTPPVAGRAARFVTHISELGAGTPRSAGPVKFVFRQDGAAFDHPQAGPERPGIYVPAITFPAAGDWQASLIIPGETNTVIELGTVKVYATGEAAARAEFPAPPEGISFLKEQQWSIRLRGEPAAIRAMTERLPAPGRTRAKPGWSAPVVAPLAGQLLAPEGGALPDPGARVEAGAVLARIQPRFSETAARWAEIESEFGQAGALVRQAEAALSRTKRLAAAQAKSEREVEEAEAALAAAQARHQAASALRGTYAGAGSNEPARGFEVRAPISGVITTVSDGWGGPVAEGQVIAGIANAERLWLEARAPEGFAGRLMVGEGSAGASPHRGGGDALCEVLDGSGRLFSIREAGGHFVFAGLEVDAQTRTLPVVFELDNRETQLRIGQAVRLHIETAQAGEALAIPDSALVEEGGLFIAFVQISGETFERRELRLGLRDGDWVEVLAGLSPGERVVTRGAYSLRLAAASGALPAHGHTH